MQAVKFVGVGRPAQIEDVPKPSPGAGQVLIRIGGAGVCHSDLHVMEEELGFKAPFTLGHENAGWVAAVLATSRIRAESRLEFEIIDSFNGYSVSWSNSEMRLVSISRMTEWVRRAVRRLWSKLDLRSS